MRTIDADALLERWCSEVCKAKPNCKEDCMLYDYLTIDSLSPTIETEQQWIPCSERLPEPRMAVLGYAPKYQNIYALYYDTVLGWMVWSPIRDDCFPNSQGEIVAWMPLPEPYKGVTE